MTEVDAESLEVSRDQSAERPARWSIKMLRAPLLVASLGRGGTMTQMFRLLISDRAVYDESRR